MFLLDTACFVETAENRGRGFSAVFRLQNFGRIFIVLIDDKRALELVCNKARELKDNFSLRALLALLAAEPIDWSERKAHFALIGAHLGEFAAFNLNAPPLLAKNEVGQITHIGSSYTDINGETIVIAGELLNRLASMFFTLDSKLCAVMENHLPFCFSKKEIESALTDFTDDNDFDFVFVNSETSKTRILSREDTIEAKLEAIKQYEGQLEELLEKYVPEDDVAATNTLLIFNELVVNAYEHGSLGIDKTLKQTLIAEGEYDDYIAKLQAQTDAKLKLSIEFFQGGFLKMSVTDQGSGFDYERQLSSKEAFVTGVYRGRGMLMARQNCAALFYSNGGRTVTFFMRFGKQKHGGEALSDEAMLRSVTVLYVEDDLYIRSHVENLLKRAVKNLLLAENGSQAFALFERYHPDIVVTDVEMPVMGGLELAFKIRAVSSDTPIVVTTAHSDETFFAKALDAGVDKFLVKPVRIPNLRSVLYRFARVIYLQKATRNDHQRAAQTRISNDDLDRLTRDDSALLPHIQVAKYPLGGSYGIVKIDERVSLFFVLSSTDRLLLAMAFALLNTALDSSFLATINAWLKLIKPFVREYDRLSAAFYSYDHVARELSSTALQLPPFTDDQPKFEITSEILSEPKSVQLSCSSSEDAALLMITFGVAVV